VRQLCPETFTSAPGGSDSNRSAAVVGDDLRKSRPGIEDEHAATIKLHAKTPMTLLMSKSHRTMYTDSLPALQLTRWRNLRFPTPGASARGPKFDLKCGSSMVAGVSASALPAVPRGHPGRPFRVGGRGGTRQSSCASGWAVSKAQYDQHNKTDPDYQCRKRYGIMI